MSETRAWPPPLDWEVESALAPIAACYPYQRHSLSWSIWQ